MFARFDENPAMTLQDIKKTKRYGQMDGRTHGCMHAHTDNVKKIIFSEPNSFMHMVNVSILYRQSIKLFHKKLY